MMLPFSRQNSPRARALRYSSLLNMSELHEVRLSVLDLAPVDGSDPGTNFETIENELRAHDPRLAALPRILALSKSDLEGSPR